MGVVVPETPSPKTSVPPSGGRLNSSSSGKAQRGPMQATSSAARSTPRVNPEPECFER